MRRWQIRAAKARLRDVLAASRRAPQQITVGGRRVAGAISRELSDRFAARRLRFLEFSRRSPLVGVELERGRDRSAAPDALR